jgi:hypothetical protein
MTRIVKVTEDEAMKMALEGDEDQSSLFESFEEVHDASLDLQPEINANNQNSK